MTGSKPSSIRACRAIRATRLPGGKWTVASAACCRSRSKASAEDALNVVKRCKVFTRATSLGGVESLIEHRYTIEGENSPIPKDWLRLSIGIESVDDLIADLEQALE